MLRFFPPVVTGTIILVIGISLMRIGINWVFGNPFGPTAPSIVNPDHAKWLADVNALGRRSAGRAEGPVAGSQRAQPEIRAAGRRRHRRPGAGRPSCSSPNTRKGFVANISVLLGIIIGAIVASAMGFMNFDKVAKAGWFDVVLPFQFGLPIFDPILILTMTW